VTGDVVVLAVPHPALDGILAAYGEQFAGKVVVDITNPVNFETFDSLVVPADSSAAELAAQPGRPAHWGRFGADTLRIFPSNALGDRARGLPGRPAHWGRFGADTLRIFPSNALGDRARGLPVRLGTSDPQSEG